MTTTDPSSTLSLKPISEEAIPQAVDKAKHYRLLNDPEQAESICLDVLAVDPDHQEALVVLILAMADQFATAGASPSRKVIREYVSKLDNEYQRVYYTGVVVEREAYAYLGRGKAGYFAYDGFREAMTCYEQAAELRPQGNDDPILRWNSCLRTIRREKLRPRPDDGFELPLD